MRYSYLTGTAIPRRAMKGSLGEFYGISIALTIRSLDPSLSSQLTPHIRSVDCCYGPSFLVTY